MKTLITLAALLLIAGSAFCRFLSGPALGPLGEHLKKLPVDVAVLGSIRF